MASRKPTRLSQAEIYAAQAVWEAYEATVRAKRRATTSILRTAEEFGIHVGNPPTADQRAMLQKLRTLIEALGTRRSRPSEAKAATDEVDALARKLAAAIKKLGADGAIAARLSGIKDPSMLLTYSAKQRSPAAGRPANFLFDWYVGELAAIYQLGTGLADIAEVKAWRSERAAEDQTAWSPFVRFTRACFALAGETISERRIEASWSKSRRRLIEGRTKRQRSKRSPAP